MKDPKISVIIATHNRARTLARAIASVRAQTFKDWELIVVDDGSTDQTENLFQPTLRFRENRGVSAARNAGASLARGEWLAFLDSDDEWLPDKLQKQWPLTENHAWIHGEEIWVRNGVRVNPRKKHLKAGGDIFFRCVDICCVSPSTVLIHRSVFTGFREDFRVCEDFEFWLRLSAQYPIGFVESPVAIKYGGHADQLSLRFKAMDYPRVKALSEILRTLPAHENEKREYVANNMLRRCEILAQGFAKHGRLDMVAEVEAWQDQARKALSTDQSTHSTADLRPRSDSTLVL